MRCVRSVSRCLIWWVGGVYLCVYLHSLCVRLVDRVAIVIGIYTSFQSIFGVCVCVLGEGGVSLSGVVD